MARPIAIWSVRGTYLWFLTTNRYYIFNFVCMLNRPRIILEGNDANTHLISFNETKHP